MSAEVWTGELEGVSLDPYRFSPTTTFQRVERHPIREASTGPTSVYLLLDACALLVQLADGPLEGANLGLEQPDLVQRARTVQQLGRTPQMSTVGGSLIGYRPPVGHQPETPTPEEAHGEGGAGQLGSAHRAHTRPGATGEHER